jgi:hypothetical protein
MSNIIIQSSSNTQRTFDGQEFVEWLTPEKMHLKKGHQLKQRYKLIAF